MTRPGIVQKRLSTRRFHQIPETPAEDDSVMANDVTIDIPLNEDDEHEHEHDQHQHQHEQQNHQNQGQEPQQEQEQEWKDTHSKSDSISFFRYHGSMDNGEEGNMSMSEKSQLVPDCDQGSTGRRRKSKNRRCNNDNAPDDHDGHAGAEGEGENRTRLRRLYMAVMNSSIMVRYLVYITPMAFMIAIPIIVGAMAARDATIGGVGLYWFFAWIEVVWLSLWVCKILARGLPYVFQSLCGVVSPGTRKYALTLRALEIPISLVGWTGVSLITFFPIMAYNPDQKAHGDTSPRSWEKSVKNILFALFVCSLIFLTEKTMILHISINYHRKQFDARIKRSKRHVQLLSALYEASRTMFPMYCKEFYDGDILICDSMLAAAGGMASSSSSFLRGRAGIIRKVGQNDGRFADQVTEAFGNVAQEITGKHVFNPTAAHSIVTQALDKRKSSEALARRIWMSFVVEGREALYLEDIGEVLGSGREADAEESFHLLDRDGNGDISLDELILTVTEIGRMRRALNHSLHDIDQAIQVLDNLLLTVAGMVGVLVFVSFVTTGFGTVIAAGATSLLSLSFIFSATAQEVLGSCIFLFVKHPFDVGDSVDISGRSYMVERISLLFTVFRCVSDHRITQTSNAILNTLWIDNLTHADAMHEQLTISVNFNTTFADIQSLRGEMEAFVRNKENSRDFQPDVDIEVLGVGDDTDRLQLRVDIRHKSNWSNDSVRASRRSKFMCALVLAMRKLHIRGPGDATTATPEENPTPAPEPAASATDTNTNQDKRGSDTSSAQIRATQEQGQSTAHLMVPHKANPTGARTTAYDHADQSPASTNSTASLFHRRSTPCRQTTGNRRPITTTTTTQASASEFPDDTYQTPATSPEHMRRMGMRVLYRADNTSTPAQQILSRGSSGGRRSQSTSENNNESTSPHSVRYRPFSYQAYPGPSGAEGTGTGVGSRPLPSEHSEPVLQGSHYYPYLNAEMQYQPYREKGDNGALAYDRIFGIQGQDQDQDQDQVHSQEHVQGEREEQEEQRQQQQRQQEQQLQELFELPSGLEYSDDDSGDHQVSPLPSSPAAHSNMSRTGSEEQGIGKPRGPR